VTHLPFSRAISSANACLSSLTSSSVPLPFSMKTDASEAEPLLAIYLRLDLGMAADLMLQLDERDALASTQPRGMATTQLDATLSQSVLRFLQAMLNSLDAEILGPALVREIYFRVFMGEQGGSMRAALNRNKRSLAIDLKTDAGRQAIRKMARQADVIIENFRPGVMNTLGLHYASLEAANRKFVYCSISAFGQTGASRNRPGGQRAREYSGRTRLRTAEGAGSGSGHGGRLYGQHCGACGASRSSLRPARSTSGREPVQCSDHAATGRLHVFSRFRHRPGKGRQRRALRVPQRGLPLSPHPTMGARTYSGSQNVYLSANECGHLRRDDIAAGRFRAQ